MAEDYNGPPYLSVDTFITPSNGRELGAFMAGQLFGMGLPTRVRVEMKPEHLAGCAAFLLQAGVTVGPYSSGGEGGTITIEMWRQGYEEELPGYEEELPAAAEDALARGMATAPPITDTGRPKF